MTGKGTVSPGAEEVAGPFEYQFGPFQFESEIEIAELGGVRGAGERRVSIRRGEVPESLAGGAAYGRLCQVTAMEYLLEIPGVARFYVQGGDRVRVQAVAGAAVEDLTVYLLGSVVGALCHQNGLLPLHASAVEAGGRVTAFVGGSGAGKSTLAACLERRGYRIVSDDICVLEGARVIPVAGWLKLWRASLDHLGETPDERNRVYSADDKYRLYLPASGSQRPALANLVFLTRAREPDQRPALVALSAAEAIAQMLRLTYLGYITELTGSHARVFRQCAEALAGARAYRLTAPWGLERMEDVLDLLEAELLKTASAPR